MAFCLAGALSFNLASPESADNTPVFAQLMLDEAFLKPDPQFAQQALSAFRKSTLVRARRCYATPDHRRHTTTAADRCAPQQFHHPDTDHSAP